MARPLSAESGEPINRLAPPLPPPAYRARVARLVAPGGRGWVVLAATLALGLLGASLDRGGYTDAGQTVLLLVAAAALAQASLLAPAATARALRSGVVVTLALLALVTAASVLWTIGSATDALRWALALAACGAIAVAGAALVDLAGAGALGAVVAFFAAVQGAIGTAGLLLARAPLAVQIGGEWRPGASFEYPPALALLELCALPAFIALAAAPRRAVARMGAGGLVLAATILGTEGSRLPLVLAALVLAVLAWRGDTVTVPRASLIAAAILMAVMAVTANLTVARVHSRDPAVLLAVGMGLALLWPWWRERAARVGPRRFAILAVGVATLAAAAWLLFGRTGTLTGAGGGLSHGRLSYWSAAIQAWWSHPVLGSGAQTFYAAAARFQSPQDLTLFAHNLVLESAAELGIAGALLALALYGCVLAPAIRWVRFPGAASPGTWLIAPGAAAFLVQNLVDWPWHLTALTAAWAALAGGLVITAPRRRANAGYLRKPA